MKIENTLKEQQQKKTNTDWEIWEWQLSNVHSSTIVLIFVCWLIVDAHACANWMNWNSRLSLSHF